jgi:hypothetical protein
MSILLFGMSTVLETDRPQSRRGSEEALQRGSPCAVAFRNPAQLCCPSLNSTIPKSCSLPPLLSSFLCDSEPLWQTRMTHDARWRDGRKTKRQAHYRLAVLHFYFDLIREAVMLPSTPPRRPRSVCRGSRAVLDRLAWPLRALAAVRPSSSYLGRSCRRLLRHHPRR